MLMVNKWYLLGKVEASKYRKEILKSLLEKPKIPTALQKEINIKLSHISRALKELMDDNLIICLTPQLRKNKFYSITKLGKSILKG